MFLNGDLQPFLFLILITDTDRFETDFLKTIFRMEAKGLQRSGDNNIMWRIGAMCYELKAERHIMVSMFTRL